MEPLVSICTTTYQHRRYIRQTLDSFLSQKTDFPFEILVHDDCSGDGTVEILEEYARRYPDVVCPVFEKENQYSKGVPINETFNFPRARGKYIALCEGDDFWCDDGKLQAQADYMESHPDCTFCFTNGYIVEESQSFGPDWREHAREFVPYYESERPAYYGADHRYDLGEMAECARQVFRRYGMPMDLTYVGKGYYGMVQEIRRLGLRNERILFLHTGGTPLFFDSQMETTR